MAGRFFKRWPQETVEDEKVSTPVDATTVLSPTEARKSDTLNSAEEGLPDFVSERVNLHHYLLDRINLAVLDAMDEQELYDELRPLVREYAKLNDFPLSAKEMDALIIDIADEMLGLGPLEALLKDDTISDILVVGANRVFIERFGNIEKTSVKFKDEDHLMRIITKIVASVGRRVDESSPLVDARLADGSRVNVAIRPVAVDGPQVSIRKFAKIPYSLEALVKNNSLRPAMANLLAAAVQGKISLVISGGTGSGKTTLLNALSAYIPEKERLVTIEDAAELQIQQPHVVRLETRPPTLDGRNEVVQRDLVKNALRMRPDRIIVGEVRGSEAFDMLQAMNTGHEGSMTTIHANTPRDAISRIEQMVGMAGMPMTQEAIRQQISSAIRVIIQIGRESDGSRRVSSISEITGMEGDVVQVQDIIRFVRTGVSSEGQVQGEFKATGIRPHFLEEIETLGLKIDLSIFDPSNPL